MRLPHLRSVRLPRRCSARRGLMTNFVRLIPLGWPSSSTVPPERGVCVSDPNDEKNPARDSAGPADQAGADARPDAAADRTAAGKDAPTPPATQPIVQQPQRPGAASASTARTPQRDAGESASKANASASGQGRGPVSGAPRGGESAPGGNADAPKNANSAAPEPADAKRRPPEAPALRAQPPPDPRAPPTPRSPFPARPPGTHPHRARRAPLPRKPAPHNSPPRGRRPGHPAARTRPLAPQPVGRTPHRPPPDPQPRPETRATPAHPRPDRRAAGPPVPQAAQKRPPARPRTPRAGNRVPRNRPDPPAPHPAGERHPAARIATHSRVQKPGRGRGGRVPTGQRCPGRVGLRSRQRRTGAFFRLDARLAHDRGFGEHTRPAWWHGHREPGSIEDSRIGVRELACVRGHETTRGPGRRRASLGIGCSQQAWTRRYAERIYRQGGRGARNDECRRCGATPRSRRADRSSGPPRDAGCGNDSERTEDRAGAERRRWRGEGWFRTGGSSRRGQDRGDQAGSTSVRFDVLRRARFETGCDAAEPAGNGQDGPGHRCEVCGRRCRRRGRRVEDRSGRARSSGGELVRRNRGGGPRGCRSEDRGDPAERSEPSGRRRRDRRHAQAAAAEQTGAEGGGTHRARGAESAWFG